MSAGVSIAIGIAVIVLISIGVCWLNDRFMDAKWRRRNPPETIASQKHVYEARLLHPDWKFYERHLQRPTPAALRELYSDRELIVANNRDYDESHYISTFDPLDEAALVDTRAIFGFDTVPFANSDGDIIYLRPGPTETDAVFITYHDGGDTEQLAPDVSTFLQRLRETNRNV